MDSNNDTPLGFWGTESEDVISRQFPLHKACRDGDAVRLSRLVALATPDQLIAEDQFYGWTPIHWAAYFGKIDCMNGLLRTGVSVNIKTSRFRQTPGHISAFGGHPHALLELVKAGADFHARDYLGETPMHKASRVGNSHCIKILACNGARANVCNDNGHTAADLSRMQNFKECVSLLEEVNAHLEANNGFTNGSISGYSNGSSGSHLSNGNGHITANNGHTNGHHQHNGNGGNVRKRSYNEDESIPCFKRPRVNDADSPNPKNSFAGPFPLLPAHQQQPEQQPDINGLNTTQGHDVASDWAMEDDFTGSDCPPPESSSYFGDVCSPRAPSPGMDSIQDDSDLQMWGHMHGYGDTAEALPDNTDICKRYTKPSQSKPLNTLPNGVRHRGWF